MIVKVSIQNGLELGDLVEWSATNNMWVPLTSASVAHWGVVSSEPMIDQSEGSNLTLAKVSFAGDALAKASRDIPTEGGLLAIEVGGVYVDGAATDSCGLISPTSYLGGTRPANSLVSVFIR